MVRTLAAVRRLLLAGLATAALWGGPAPALADPVTLEDLALLIQGGVGDEVILGHVRRWGLERDLDAPGLVALKKAGASDALLEELVGTRGGASSGERVVDLPGGRGILFTNLDEQGRRIGGEEPERAPVNLVEAAERVVPAPVVEPAAPAEHQYPGFESFREEGFRWGTPGGYTRFKMYYSRAPYDGFRTWVFPLYWVARAPVLVAPAWSGVYAPPLIPF